MFMSTSLRIFFFTIPGWMWLQWLFQEHDPENKQKAGLQWIQLQASWYKENKDDEGCNVTPLMSHLQQRINNTYS